MRTTRSMAGSPSHPSACDPASLEHQRKARLTCGPRGRPSTLVAIEEFSTETGPPALLFGAHCQQSRPRPDRALEEHGEVAAHLREVARPRGSATGAGARRLSSAARVDLQQRAGHVDLEGGRDFRVKFTDRSDHLLPRPRAKPPTSSGMEVRRRIPSRRKTCHDNPAESKAFLQLPRAWKKSGAGFCPCQRPSGPSPASTCGAPPRGGAPVGRSPWPSCGRKTRLTSKIRTRSSLAG